ncbi:CYTH domain-containing protein [Prevotella histicola]|uniref:Adenylate cyclase n=1 Tax=Prevotella histicola F0411 TaxID=857291 RepID=G6AJQ4_9BACT|nr:CYTH domain-containing protein [Prevotella histicola]EHG15153.1 adenylate cyclase [Prevotella histicola F0411]QUB83964.1 CYTH domain-containing protein [Prevotella histicola]
MSGLEIERKFLVHKWMDWKRLASSCSHIQQGYFAAVNTVRVRIRDDKGYLTIKGPSHNGGLSRYEFEKEITLQEAQQLMLLCESGVIDKHRYLVPYAGHTFEVDEFHGDNDGLVMAEVELKSENEPFESPDFIGKEVTGNRRFYNSHMRKNPFKLWRDTLPEEYR